jgi:hypothetical protein
MIAFRTMAEMLAQQMQAADKLRRGIIQQATIQLRVQSEVQQAYQRPPTIPPYYESLDASHNIDRRLNEAVDLLYPKGR